MATVHYGRLLGPVGFSRTVAIKRLHAQFAKDPDFVSMFIDEARLVARIQHPNVVPMLDIVVTEGELFLVMEYVQGETLARLIRGARERGERIPAPVVASILSHALHGLHAAHEAKDERGNLLGLVHRDVSPQNVIVGVDGVARVLDFGVAKATVRLGTTRDGQLKGKLAYMAPEQVAGHARSPYTDVYASGVMLWEGLTMRRLHDAGNEAQLMHKVLNGALEPPSIHCKDIQPALDDIVMRSLDVDPAKRFQTAREMALALERSVPMARTSEVGEWVETNARERLAQHAERMAEIESSAHERSARIESPARAIAASNESTKILVSSQHPNPGDEGIPPPAPGHGQQPKRDGSPRRRILVIDDSEVMLNRIRSALEAEAYDVITTTRAVGNARHILSCDLAIIDYHMPGIDGGTVIQSLRSATAAAHNCLFYLYTSDQQVAKDHQKLGFDGVLTEKGDEVALVKQVRAVFRMAQMRAMQKKVVKR